MAHQSQSPARDGARQGISAELNCLASTESPSKTQSNLTRPIAEIRVGERHRREIGDIDGLARSIAELGLLHPIVVTPAGALVAGERRLRAALQLGWAEIPVTVVDDQIVRGEYAENTHRKDFTLSEAVAIKRALEPIEREAAKQRQGTRTDKHPEKFSTSSDGRALDKIAKAAGMHRTTLAKAEAVVDAAEAEPEKFGRLLADMDRTGRVNAPFKRLKVAKQAERIRAEPPPLPGNGPYHVATIDIAWAAEPEGDADRAARRGYWPYPTLTIEQACALPVGKIMADDAILWMWVTNFILARGLHVPVLKAWSGFEPKTIVTWSKEKAGIGIWLRGQTEHAVMAVRGKPVVTLVGQSTLLLAPVRAHSQKPPEFYDLVESLCPAPRYADLFSRYRHNERWDCHGDEAPPANSCSPILGSEEPPPDSEWEGIPDFLRRVAP